MGKIDIIGKWDMDNFKWFIPTIKKVQGRSLAIVNYSPVICNPNMANDYIVFCTGSRVENFSHDAKTASSKKENMQYAINYFENIHKNTYIKMILLDADAPLKESGRKISSYIDILANNRKSNSVNLIGFSKGGVMCFDMIKILKSPHTLQKTNLFTVATPFSGTVFGSPQLIYEKLNQYFYNLIGNTNIARIISKTLMPIYNTISSNSHMDYDIAIPGSIPESLMDFYDPTLIKNIFSNENINAVKKLMSYKNIYSGIDEDTLKECFKNRDFLGIALCLLNYIIFDKPADGLVDLDSQKSIERYYKGISTSTISSTTHSLFSNPRAFHELLWIINDTIDETNEKKVYILKK